MDTVESNQKKISLLSAVIACGSAFLVSAGGAAAWATQFETKTHAAVSAQEVVKVKTDVAQSAVEISAMREELSRIRATTDRMDDKIDKILLRSGGRQ